MWILPLEVSSGNGHASAHKLMWECIWNEMELLFKFCHCKLKKIIRIQFTCQ